MEKGSSWHQWKKKLGKVLDVGEFIGLSDQHLQSLAYRMGNFFAHHFDPDNREQRLIKELWDEATESEQKVLTSLMIRLVKNN